MLAMNLPTTANLLPATDHAGALDEELSPWSTDERGEDSDAR